MTPFTTNLSQSVLLLLLTTSRAISTANLLSKEFSAISGEDVCENNLEDMFRGLQEGNYHYHGTDYPFTQDIHGAFGVSIPSEGYGVHQRVSGKEWGKTLQIVDKTSGYMVAVREDDMYSEEIKKECQLRHELCSFWAGMGQCQTNPVWMNEKCAPSCQTCFMNVTIAPDLIQEAASGLMGSARHQEAMKKIDSAIQLYSEKHGANSWFVAAALMLKGTYLFEQGRSEEAVTIYEEILSIKGVHHHGITATTKNDLGAAIMNSNPEKAKKLFEEARESYRVLGFDDSHQLVVVLNANIALLATSSRHKANGIRGRQILTKSFVEPMSKPLMNPDSFQVESYCGSDDLCAHYFSGVNVAIDGVNQTVAGEEWKEVLQTINYTQIYIEATKRDEFYSTAIENTCKLRHDHCSFWAAKGECSKHPVFMNDHCAPSCGTCFMNMTFPASTEIVNAILLRGQGEVDKAQQILEDVLATYEELYGENSWHVASARSQLALVYIEKGWDATAIKLLNQVLSSKGMHHHAMTAGTLLIVGAASMDRNDPGQAQVFFERCVDSYKRLNRDEDHDALILAEAHVEMAKKSAERKSMAVFQILLGIIFAIFDIPIDARHIDVALDNVTFGTLVVIVLLVAKIKGYFGSKDPKKIYETAVERLQKGKLDQSLKMLDRAVAVLKKQEDEDNVLFIDIYRTMASIKERQGDFRRAAELLELSVTIHGKNHPEEDAMVASIYADMARILCIQGDCDSAIAFFEQALSAFEKVDQLETESVASICASVGDLFRDQGRLSMAERRYEQALSTYDKTIGLDHSDVGTVSINLGNVYRQKDKLVEAMGMFVQGLRIYKRSVGESHEFTVIALASIARVQTLEERFDEASSSYAEALAMCQRAEEKGGDASSLQNLRTKIQRDMDQIESRDQYQ